MRSVTGLYRLIILVYLSALPTGAHSAIPVDIPDVSSVSVTAEILKAKIKEANSANELTEETKNKLIALYRKAISHFETARSNNEKAEAFRQARETAAQQAEIVRAKQVQAENGSPVETLAVSDATALEDLEPLLLKEKADLAAVEAKLAELEGKLLAETERPTQARQRLTGAVNLQEEISTKLKLSPPSQEPPNVTEAQRWVLEAQRKALSAEIQMLDQELLSQPLRLELLNALRDRAAFRVDWVGSRVRFLEEQVSQRRRAEAATAKAETDEAKQAALSKHPVIWKQAEDNATLSDELGSVAADLERITSQDDEANREAKRIEEDFRNARQKFEIAGLSQALGQVLQEQRRSLPDLRLFRKQTRVRENLIAESGLRHIRFNEQHRLLRDLDTEVGRLTAGLTADEVAFVQEEVEDLLKKRRSLLETALSTNAAYLRALGELDFAQRRLFATAEAYDVFLAERLLWIRSTPRLNVQAMLALPDEASQLFVYEDWFKVLDILAQRLNDSPGFILSLVFVAVLLWKERPIKRALVASGKKLGKPTTDRFVYTLQAVGLTLLAALPWPLLAAAIGWQLRFALEATEFSKAVGMTLRWMAIPLYSLIVFRLLCLPRGVAALHFRWPESSLHSLRRAIRRLMIFFLPGGVVTALLISLDPVTLGGALGKIALALTSVALAFFLFRVLHPRKGALQVYMIRHPGSTVTRLRMLWIPLVVTMPLAMAGLALAGYIFTAGTLIGNLINTLWLVLGLVVIRQLAERWLLLTRRKLAYQAALERRALSRERETVQETSPLTDELIPIEIEEPKVDLLALSDASRKLINAAMVFGGILGLWIIWSGVLPAFGILNEISLWDYATVVGGEKQLVPVTLADMGLAMLIAIITVIAAKSVPALTEIVLLERIDMAAGTRYAVTTLSGYGIAACGVLLALNVVGASWSQLQWLVAALSVGIGFGLQEIVANFISGLIILFERPIRVGDFVTVGDTDGVVTRIRIRATTIVNQDRKELLVPNKEFITGRLLNWSLSDQTTRILLPVGVAYGSDVRKVMAILVEIAKENPAVLEDPEPSVIFETFGDNTLNMVLRCFVESVDYRWPTVSELNQAINDKFEQAGIVISFPQRDVHLDTNRPLDIRIRRDSAGTGPKGGA